MTKCFFLLDNILQNPYVGLSFGELNGKVQSIDQLLGHFENFTYRNFFHINQIKLLPEDKIKFLLHPSQMPINADINLSKNAIDLINNDKSVYLCLISVLESRIIPQVLKEELEKNKILPHKVVVITSNYDAHNTTIDGIRYCTVNFWESISRHHHQTMSDIAITTPDELTIDNANKKFICLNRNIKPHRIWLMYSILKSGIIDQGHVSYHLPEVDETEYAKCAKEQHTLKRIPNELHDDYKNYLATRMYKRKLDRLKSHVINYSDSIKNYYNDSLLSVVTESDSHENFITEKTYKAIMNLHPFFIIGNPAQHSLLRTRGYETFEDLFGVNCVMNYTQAVKLWQNIYNKDIGVLKQDIKMKYLDKLIHNQQLFLSRKICWNNITKTLIEIVS